MFGPVMGMLLGLFAGAVVFVHALLLALDFYEVYFMIPLNTFVLLAFIGAVAGWLFSVVVRKCVPGKRRIALIAVVCLALSFVASALMMANLLIAYGGLDSLDMLRQYLFNSPLGILVQALVDAVAMAILCGLTDWTVGRMARRGGIHGPPVDV